LRPRLTVTAPPATVTRNPDASSYVSGTIVTLTRTNTFPYVFQNWSGSSCETNSPFSFTATNNPLSITLTSSVTVIGAFKPVNDNFADRIILTGSRVGATSSTLDATREIGEPNHAGATNGQSVWWTWTAPANELVAISTYGSDFNTLLAVYTGDSVSNLTSVAGHNGFGPNSHVIFKAHGGTAYQIVVDGYNGAAGNVNLMIAMSIPPVSYDLINGETFGSTPIRDDTYSGAGNPNMDLSFLSGGLGKLTDGVTSPDSFSPGPGYDDYSAWVGWYSIAPQITFDFGRIWQFDSVFIHTVAYTPAAVRVFTNVDFTFSNDGTHFANVLTYTTSAAERVDGLQLIQAPMNVGARFVRAKVANGGYAVFLSEFAFVGPIPPQFSPPIVLTNATIQLTIFANSNTNYQIQASTDLTTWVTLTNILGAANTMEFTDTVAASFPYRFYRVLLFP